MSAKVLDSFALIAYFRDEPGAEMVENLLVTAGKKDSPLHMTDVNYAEVKYSIMKKHGAKAWEEAAKILQGLPIDFHSTTREMSPATRSSRPWRKKSKSHGSSNDSRSHLPGESRDRHAGRPAEKEFTTAWEDILLAKS